VYSEKILYKRRLSGSLYQIDNNSQVAIVKPEKKTEIGRSYRSSYSLLKLRILDKNLLRR
jgi:hypothetical protein